MIIAARYSFNHGAKIVGEHFPDLLREIEDVVLEVDAESCKTKVSREKTMQGQVLYSPVALNDAFKMAFTTRSWEHKRVHCIYSSEYYTEDYQSRAKQSSGFREMDFVKQGLGVEVQFGKYSFMVYNVAAKMTIFRNLGHITAGVEIVPVKQFALQMSTGVSYFEQFVWDLEHRGIADIDVPVLILGIDTTANKSQ